MLDSTNCSEHDKTLFCKTCHARKFGPKGVGFGMGAGALNMDNGERQGNTDFVSNKPIDPNNYGFFWAKSISVFTHVRNVIKVFSSVLKKLPDLLHTEFRSLISSKEYHRKGIKITQQSEI